MDEKAYQKLFKDFMADISEAEDEENLFLPLLNRYRQRYLKASGNATKEDVQRARHIDVFFKLGTFASNRLIANYLGTLGDIADLTAEKLAIVLWHNEEALVEVKKVLTRNGLKLRKR